MSSNKLTCCYAIYLHRMRKKESVRYIVKKYIQEMICSIYCLYKYSDIDPNIVVFISKSSHPDFNNLCNNMIKHGIIHEQYPMGFSSAPWGTKTLAWCKSLEKLDSFLYLDTDVKFVKPLPINKFYNKSLLLCPGNPKHINKTSKVVKKYFGIKLSRNVGLPVTWFNRKGKPSIDYNLLRKKLVQNLSTMEKSVKIQGPTKGGDDQMIMSITLAQMKIPFNSVISHPDLFSSRHSLYYKHNHSLSTSKMSINDAIEWFYDRNINLSKYSVKKEDT